MTTDGNVPHTFMTLVSMPCSTIVAQSGNATQIRGGARCSNLPNSPGGRLSGSTGSTETCGATRPLTTFGGLGDGSGTNKNLRYFAICRGGMQRCRIMGRYSVIA